MLKPGIEVTEGAKAKTVADQSIGISPVSPISVKATEGSVTRYASTRPTAHPSKAKSSTVCGPSASRSATARPTPSRRMLSASAAPAARVFIHDERPDLLTQAYLTRAAARGGVAQPVAVKFDEVIPNPQGRAAVHPHHHHSPC